MSGSLDKFDTIVFEDRDCWRQKASEADILEFEKLGISVTDKIYFLTDPGLDENHIVEIFRKADPTIGTTYKVATKADPDASAGLGVVFRIMVVRTTTGSTP